ncbi:hypothetical protein SVIOM74S_04187 [Streptomyces violarus]
MTVAQRVRRLQQAISPGQAFTHSTGRPLSNELPERHQRPRDAGPVTEISGAISAIVIGIVISFLGRLLIPARQRVGIHWTILIGLAAAFIGIGIASGLDVADTKGVDWVEWLIQSPSPPSASQWSAR